MAKIKFSNGQTVNFEGDPTEADVEEVARKLGISSGSASSPTQESTQEKPFLDRIAESKISQGIQKIFPGAKLGEAVGTSVAAGGRLLEGDVEGFKNIMAGQVPAKQVAGDVANIVLTSGGAALPVARGSTALGTIGKTTLQGAAIGAGQSGAKTLAEGGTNEEIARNAAIGGVVSGVVSGGISAFGELLKKSGEKIVNTVIKPSSHDITDGFSMDTIKKHNLGGSLSEMNRKTEAKLNHLSTQLAEKLKGSDATINLSDAYDETVKSLTGNKLKTFGSNTSMGKALEQLQDEIADAGGSALTIPDAQLVKQASGKMGAWQFGAQDPDSTAREKVYTAFYHVMKNQIEKNSPAGVKEINKQISELIPVSNAITRRIPVAERNNLLSLQDIITLTAGSMNPNALGGFALSLAQKSGAFGNALMKLGEKSSAIAPISGQISAQGVPSLLPPQSPEAQGEISRRQPSFDITTLSPEVQRIINMSK